VSQEQQHQVLAYPLATLVTLELFLPLVAPLELGLPLVLAPVPPVQEHLLFPIPMLETVLQELHQDLVAHLLATLASLDPLLPLVTITLGLLPVLVLPLLVLPLLPLQMLMLEIVPPELLQELLACLLATVVSLEPLLPLVMSVLGSPLVLALLQQQCGLCPSPLQRSLVPEASLLEHLTLSSLTVLRLHLTFWMPLVGVGLVTE